MPTGHEVQQSVIEIVPIDAAMNADIERLLDHAFGTDRHERTAYKVRGSSAPIAGLSFAAIEEGRLVGSIQCWPVIFTADDGRACDLVMVGPVAVEPTRQRDGLGRKLMQHMLTRAAETGADAALMLIGDPEYYGRFFGFDTARTSGWRLPGPVERRRLLARGADVPVGEGELGPRIALPA